MMIESSSGGLAVPGTPGESMIHIVGVKNDRPAAHSQLSLAKVSSTYLLFFFYLFLTDGGPYLDIFT
jgi:hypothetical protein